MKRVGLYFNNILSDNELNVFVKNNLSKDQKYYSNLNHEKFSFIDDGEEMDIYQETTNRINNLHKEFYNKYESSPICNKYFNFWFHLRFNSYLELLKVNKVKKWVTQLEKKNKKKIENFYFIDLPQKTQRIVAVEIPNARFINSKKKSSDSKNKKTLLTLFALLFSGISKLKLFHKSSAKILIVSRAKDFSNIYTKEGFKIKDKYLYYLNKSIKKETKTVILHSDFLSKKGISNYSKKKIETTDYINEALFFKALLSPKLYFNLFKIFLLIRKEKKKKDNTLSCLILNNKEGIFSEYITYHMYYRFFKINNFKKVILSDEMSPITNAIVRAAKNNKLEVFGIQHGEINEKNPGYNYSKLEIDYSDPFPQKLFVWGNNEFKYFQNIAPSFMNRIIPVGNIMFDGIKYLKNSSNNKFTILLATQPQPILTNRIAVVADFIEAVNQLEEENIEIIIRLHPREVNDFDIYVDYFKKLKNHDLIIDKGQEILTQLSKIDVLVTSYSSIAKEAMILGKHIILLDYENTDFTGLIKKKIAHKSTNSDELYSYLERIKSNKITINEEQKKLRDNLIISKDNETVAERMEKHITA